MASCENPIGKVTAARQKNITEKMSLMSKSMFVGPKLDKRENVLNTCHKTNPFCIWCDCPVPECCYQQNNCSCHTDTSTENTDQGYLQRIDVLFEKDATVAKKMEVCVPAMRV